MALPTVADLKKHINIPADVTADDAELGEVLDAAVELVASMVGPLESGAVTEVHRGVDSRLLVLRQMPATSLTSVSLRYATGETSALTLSDFDLDTEAGIVRLVSGGWLAGTYVVVYDAGRATLPASVRLAVLIVAAHLWETQRVPGVNRFGSPDEPSVSRGYAIPNRAAELLAPYRTSVGLA